MRIVLLLVCILIFGQISAFADEATIIQKLTSDGSLEQLRNTFKKYPAQYNLERASVRYLAVKNAYDNALKKWYVGYPVNDDTRGKIRDRAEFNYFYTKCKAGNADACKDLENAKITNAKSFDFKTLEVIEIPKVDFKNSTFTTADGETYSAKTGEVIASTKPNKLKSLDEVDSDLKCEWAELFPRKILHGPGCKAGGSKICTGYVTCSSKNRKVNRLATCSERLCTDSTATECANQPGYGSKNAAGVSDQYQSDSDDTDASNVKSNQ